MPGPPLKIRRPSHITVGQFYESHRERLDLTLVGCEEGLDRHIIEPTLNRPGLALSGFLSYFAFKRLQIMGNSELSYIQDDPDGEALAHFREICALEIPCIVVSRGLSLPIAFMNAAAEAGVSVFETPTSTMKFVNAATIMLEMDFAASCSMHGSMVDVQGIGILIRGTSGSGKSETVVGLLGRGASLVADDLVHLREFEGREIIGSAPKLGENTMEVRGIGLIKVTAMFGIGALRLRKRLDLVIELKAGEDLNNVERIGGKDSLQTTEILGIEIPFVELPVAAGRDIARLVEIAALDQKLKSLGYNAAMDFEKKLLNSMDGGTIY